MLEGFQIAISSQYLIYMVFGVFIGIVVGALPGLTATMGTALLLPFTFTLPPGVAIGMLGALYVSSHFADAIPACLVNTPGTAAALATSFDGYPMAQQGRGKDAIIASSFSSMVGATVGGVIFMLAAPPLARVALSFGPPEFFWVGIFALTIVGSISGESFLKGIAGGVLGLLIGTIGLSTTGAAARFTLGLPQLRGGVDLVAALIGVFAIPQVIGMVRKSGRPLERIETVRSGSQREVILEILAKPVNIIRSSLIGTFIGILPGAGGPVAALVSYNEAKRWGRDTSRFGKGDIQGVVASETGNSAAAGGAMVPMLALGIPGSGPTAVILGALLLQGLRPGPSLFASQPELVYGFAWSIIFAGIFTFAVGAVLSSTIARLVDLPVHLLAPMILVLSVLGSFAIRSYIIDVYFMLGLGVATYLLNRMGVEAGPIGLGIILSPIIEPALVASIALTGTNSTVQTFFLRPVSAILIVSSIASAAWAVRSRARARRNEETALGAASRVGLSGE